MTPEPAQPAESPEARARLEAALADAERMEGRTCAVNCVDLRAMLAATTARPTERGAVDKRREINTILSGLLQKLQPQCPDLSERIKEGNKACTEIIAEFTPPVTVAATDQAGEVEALRKGLAVARRAIMKAAQDTLWCDDTPAETVVDRIDALLAEADGQQSFAALATQTATGRTMGGEDVDALVKALVESESEATVRDMAGHVGDQVHAVLKRHGMTMKTTGGAIAVGVMAAAQVLNDTYEFARRSLENEEEAKEMAAAMRVLFGQNLAPALQELHP